MTIFGESAVVIASVFAITLNLILPKQQPESDCEEEAVPTETKETAVEF